MLRIATRGSALARWQAERVGALLREPVEYVIVTTTGDRDQRSDLHSIGGTGVFVKEVQQAVLDGRADLAVHSAKDLPSETPLGLVLASVPERGDPRDALVGASLEAIPTGGRIATGSVRRRAQLAAARPDVVFAPFRGSIETRLRKRSEEGHDAVVVAVAALERLGRLDQAAEVLDPGVLLPQAAQGALGVECRADDARHAGATHGDRRSSRPRRGSCRAGVSRRARGRVLAAVRRARAVRRRDRPGRARRAARGSRRPHRAPHARRRIGSGRGRRGGRARPARGQGRACGARRGPSRMRAGLR